MLYIDESRVTLVYPSDKTAGQKKQCSSYGKEFDDREEAHQSDFCPPCRMLLK